MLLHRNGNKKFSPLISSCSRDFVSSFCGENILQKIALNSYDITDNKTDNSSFVLKNLNMNELFREDERIKTFLNWPLDFIDKNCLAQTGMYYLNDDDKVKCYFCEVEIGQWEQTDNPVSEHMRWSPNCPLIRRRTTNNIPLNSESLNVILPPLSFDVCGGIDAIEIRPSAYAEGSVSTTSSQSNYFPDHPEYAIESARLRSFGEWPRIMKQKPATLSEAGFFYTGIGDRVKCFSCGGGLKDWDDNDDPWEQHALWLSHCRFLKLIKGQSFIDSIISKYSIEQIEEKKENSILSKSETTAEENTNPTEILHNSSVTTATTPVWNPEAAGFVKSLHNEHPLKKLETYNPNNCLLKSQTSAVGPDNLGRKSIPEEKLCKICYASEYNTAFMPCGHVVACANCASSVTKCPMCRKPFISVMRVYFS